MTAYFGSHSIMKDAFALEQPQKAFLFIELSLDYRDN
jgi:hypothetical protein